MSIDSIQKSNHNSKNKFITVLLWISLVYSAQWINSCTRSILHDSILSYVFVYFAQPFVLASILILVYFLSSRKISLRDVPELASFWLFLVVIVWSFIEWYHLPDTYSMLRQFKFIFYSKLISSFMICCLLAAIFEISNVNIVNSRFPAYVMAVVSIKAVVLMFIAAFAIIGVIPYCNNIIFNSSQAYESLALIFFVMMVFLFLLTRKQLCFFLIIGALPMFYFECRGASLIFVGIFLLFLAQFLIKKRSRTHKLVLLILTPFFLLSFLNTLEVTPLGITSIRNYIKPKVINNNFVSNLPCRDRTQVGLLSISLVNYMRTGDNSLEAVLGNEPDVVESTVMTETTLSAYSRIGSIILGMKTFFRNPVLGIGSHAAYELHVAGYGIHSLIPLFLASYGLVGFIPFLIVCLFAIANYARKTENYLKMIAASFFVVSVMMLVNSFIWWYSFIYLFLCCRQNNFNFELLHKKLSNCENCDVGHPVPIP